MNFGAYRYNSAVHQEDINPMNCALVMLLSFSCHDIFQVFNADRSLVIREENQTLSRPSTSINLLVREMISWIPRLAAMRSIISFRWERSFPSLWRISCILTLISFK